jgi:hypothetical protein
MRHIDAGPATAPEESHLQEVCDMTIVRRASPLCELVSLRQAMDGPFTTNSTGV